MQWSKDPAYENNLQYIAEVKFKIVRDIPIALIDRAEGMRRQARADRKLNDEKVELMAAAMRHPAAMLPMGLLNRFINGSYEYYPLDMNHRIAAAIRNGAKTVDAYVTEVSGLYHEALIPRVVNNWEGSGLSRDEMLANANFMINNFGALTKEIIAKFPELKNGKALSAYRGRLSTAQAIQEMGIKGCFSKSVLSSMSKLVKTDKDALGAVATLINQHKLKSDDANDLVNDVKKGRSDADRKERVAVWRELLSASRSAPAQRAGRQVRNRVLVTMRRLHNQVVPARTLTQLQLEGLDLDIVARLWDDICDNFGSLLSKHQRVTLPRPAGVTR